MVEGEVVRGKQDVTELDIVFKNRKGMKKCDIRRVDIWRVLRKLKEGS